MSAHMSHDQYLQSLRDFVVATAQAMLSGEQSFLIGARRLCAAQDGLRAERDEHFMTFEAIDSSTDALPLGEVRQHWDPVALKNLEPEIQAAEQWARDIGTPACVALIAMFQALPRQDDIA